MIQHLHMMLLKENLNSGKTREQAKKKERKKNDSPKSHNINYHEI